MPSLLESVSELIGQDQIGTIARQIGASNEQTEQAIGLALPTLLGALANHSENEAGANQLHEALQTEYDGSGLNNVNNLLGGSGGLGGLLSAVLGSRQGRVEQGIGKVSGLSGTQVASLLAILGPIVLSVLGRAQRGASGGAGGLTNILRKEKSQMQNQAGGGLLAGLLDQDGDGDFDLQDVLKLGMNKLFGRK